MFNHDKRYGNPYLAATSMPPGRDQLEAAHQFLDDEIHRLTERLEEIEADDGSIPEESREEWSMVKGRLDQTRLFQTLVVQPLLMAEMQGDND